MSHGDSDWVSCSVCGWAYKEGTPGTKHTNPAVFGQALPFCGQDCWEAWAKRQPGVTADGKLSDGDGQVLA